MRGQVNLRDAVNGNITFKDDARKRVYQLKEKTAKLFVRPRGWHLREAHVIIDGEPAIGCLLDFGLYFFHNQAKFRATQGAGFGPFFYLPKMEHSRSLSFSPPLLSLSINWVSRKISSFGFLLSPKWSFDLSLTLYLSIYLSISNLVRRKNKIYLLRHPIGQVISLSLSLYLYLSR